MNVALRVVSAGLGVTLQDGGRRGLLRFGVSEAGPMDPLAHATANLAVDNDRGAATIEVSLGGIALAIEGGAASVAVAGGEFAVALDGQRLPAAAVIPLVPDAKLSIRPGSAGAWCYVAVAGRIDIAPVLGSVATHTRTHLGGIGGRALRSGDLLPIHESRLLPTPAAEILAPWLARSGEAIRVILGPQDDYFARDQIAAFLAGPWTVSSRSGRMAYLLDGPRLRHRKGFNIVSDGIAMGAIQVPGEGRPVVLMADRQPTGGYPKIANVIGPDLGRFAQLRPGATFRFAAVSLEQAVALRRNEAAALAQPPPLQPLVRADLPSEFLLGLNLVDGVTAGAEPG
jgi:biotin-dependent carboxylase-like uncharacterized protein